MRGSLTPDALARLLRALAVSRREGILHLHNVDGVSKRIYFRQGSIVFAGSDDEQERLGEVLVRAGKLKRSDLELALRVMKETGESLGKTVVEMGFTSQADIVAHALERTKSIIHSVFRWPAGTFHFEPRDVDIGDEMALELPTVEMILEAARSIDDIDAIRLGLGGMKAVLRQPANPLLPYGGSLSSSVEWLLYQANGVTTIEEIVRGAPLGEDRTLRSIYALVLAGILEIEDPERAVAARAEDTRVTLGADTHTFPPDGPSTPSVPPIPKALGRYEVERVLGRGAMGAVYLGRDPAIERTVAIKLIQTAVHLTPRELEKYRERFYREAKAAGQLLHPGIVTVFDVGHTAEATPFIVMEYVQGKTLREILGTEKPTHQEALRIGAKILEPLAYAHFKGIVHRDIKPANILVTPAGDVKVMDFGIAHVVGSELTQAEDVLGSPNYMAPEQLSMGTIDARTDLFAVGVVLYRMLTGALPFEGDSFAAIAKAILFEEPPPPESLDSALSPRVSGLVLRCLAKEPSLRFQTADELKHALLSHAGDRAVSDVDVSGSSAAFTRSGTALFGKPPEPWESADRSPPDRGSAMLNELPGADRGRTRSMMSPARLGLAAGALTIALLLAFGLSRSRYATESSAPQQMTASPAPGPSPTTERADLVGASEPLASAAEPERSDAELYHEASVSLERGDLSGSKATLETLLRRNPGFEGAAELLVRVNRELRGDNRNRTADVPPAPEPTPVEAQLFYQARLAFERGELEESQRQLESLVRESPTFEGASELLVRVNDEIWKKSLPLSFRAKHSHRIGACSGTLTLAAWGLRYSSKEHEWKWEFRDVRLMGREGSGILYLETHETEALALGRPKNYKFELLEPMRDVDWSRYEKLSR